jgi:hypothetical protein
LAEKEIELPAPGLKEGDYFAGLSRLVMRLDDLPPDLIKAIYAVEEMATEQGEERFQAAIERSELALTFQPESSRGDIAMHAYLAAPEVLAQQSNELRLARLSAFEYCGSKAPVDRSDATWTNGSAPGISIGRLPLWANSPLQNLRQSASPLSLSCRERARFSPDRQRNEASETSSRDLKKYGGPPGFNGRIELLPTSEVARRLIRRASLLPETPERRETGTAQTKQNDRRTPIGNYTYISASEEVRRRKSIRIRSRWLRKQGGSCQTLNIERLHQTTASAAVVEHHVVVQPCQVKSVGRG